VIQRTGGGQFQFNRNWIRPKAVLTNCHEILLKIVESVEKFEGKGCRSEGPLATKKNQMSQPKLSRTVHSSIHPFIPSSRYPPIKRKHGRSTQVPRRQENLQNVRPPKFYEAWFNTVLELKKIPFLRGF